MYLITEPQHNKAKFNRIKEIEDSSANIAETDRTAGQKTD